MKNIILTLFFILFFQTAAMALESSIRFVQVTDTHFNTKNEYSVTVLKNTVKDINRLKDISFVVFTGDNLNSPKADDLDDFIKIINGLKAPYYLVIGNHDVFKSGELSKIQYNDIVRNNNFFWFYRKWNYVFKKKGYTFIVVDGAKEVIPGSAGYYRADTLEWLDKQLVKNKKHPVIIMQHYPIVDAPEFSSSRLKTHRTYQPEKYLDILDKHNNVLAVISGHFHVNSEMMRNGVYHICTPTLLSNPPVYKIVDIVSKNGLSPLVYTQLKQVEIEE